MLAVLSNSQAYTTCGPTAEYRMIYGRPLPSADGNSIFVTSNDCTLTAVDAASGQQRWTYLMDAASWMNAAESTDGAVVFAGTDGGLLYAVGAATGNPLWTKNLTLTDGGLHGKPLYSDGVVYVGGDCSPLGGIPVPGFTGHDCGLYALNASSGATLWKYALNGSRSFGMDGGAVRSVGSLYVALYTGEVASIDAATGTQKWRRQLASTAGARDAAYSVWGTPTVGLSGDFEVLYVPCYDSNLYALNAADGSRLWNHSSFDDRGHPYMVGADPVLSKDGKVLFYVSVSNYVYSLDALSGTEKWKFEGPNAYELGQSSPALSPDGAQLYVGSGTGTQNQGCYVYSIGTASGTLAWKFAHPGRNPALGVKSNCNFDAPTSVSPDGTTVYAGSSSGGVFSTIGPGLAENVFALDAATGALKWSLAA